MKTLADLFSGVARNNVSYRTYGSQGQYQRAIFHRFDIKGGDSMQNVIANNIEKANPLYRYLMDKQNECLPTHKDH